jgi:uncharacterized protein (TIGR03032 family)
MNVCAENVLSETSAEAQPAAANPPEPPVSYSISPRFVPLLEKLGAALAISSYQEGTLYLLGRNPKGGLMIDQRFFQRAMGICADNDSLVLATSFQIQRFENVLEPGQFINDLYDACYVPRISYATGELDAHDVGLLDNGEIVFVNTRYNCLAALSRRRSFSVYWKPGFITRIVNEDRCHLNGMALEGGRVRYVTAVSCSDTIDGWRDRRADGGVVIDVATGEVVCEGLSMPHSPRLAGGKLWVLNSGSGELGWVDREARRFVPVAFYPGFLRGLAIKGRYALVGLSKPRYERFEGLALDERLARADSEAWCGVQAIDLETGSCAEWFRIDGAVSEIYDVALMPGAACPMSLGFASADLRTLITYDDPSAAVAATTLPPLG